LSSYIPILVQIFTALFAPFVIFYPFYNYIYYMPYALELQFAYIGIIVYPTIIFCNYRIYCVLSQHMNSVMAILNKTESEVKNESNTSPKYTYEYYIII
jgi:hypothetical protein